MKQKSKVFIALILVFIIGLSPLQTTVFAAEHMPNSHVKGTGKAHTTEESQRFTVLILDASGSMDGTPTKVQKEAAIKFCKSMMESVKLFL